MTTFAQKPFDQFPGLEEMNNIPVILNLSLRLPTQLVEDLHKLNVQIAQAGVMGFYPKHLIEPLVPEATRLLEELRLVAL